MNPNHTSPKGVQFIAGWEGFAAYPYNDAGDNATIGYGHLLHLGPVNAADRKAYPDGLTRDQALVVLSHDVKDAEACVLRYVKPPFTLQRRFDAIVSFVYNVGCGAFSTSHLLELLNAGYMRRGAGAEMLKWDHAGGRELPGLLNRRKAERALGRFLL